MDTSSKVAVGSLDVSKRLAKVTTQREDVVRATVSETPFDVVPDGFVGVELWGIRRKVFEMQSGELMPAFSNPFSFVIARVVPDDEDVPVKVAQQVPEAVADLVVSDVFCVALEVRADARLR